MFEGWECVVVLEMDEVVVLCFAYRTYVEG